MSRVTRIAGPAALLAAAFVVLLIGLSYGGGAVERPIGDPGPVVRFGLPIAKMLVNIGAAMTLGPILLALFALSAKRDEYHRALDIAAGGAALYAVASGITGFFTFLNVTGTAITFDDQFGSKLGMFFTEVELGQAWLATTLIAATLTVLCFAVRGQTLMVFVGVFALISLVPMAQQGHAAGSAGHNAAVNALGLHLLFAAVWLGGLLTIVLMRNVLEGDRIVPVMKRYSTIALIAFIVVAISGYASAELRIGSLDRLLTPYGVLVIGKVAALVVLGIFGAMHRTWLIGRMATAAKTIGSYFWWIIVAELAFMGVASGLASALARTATPIPEELGGSPTAAELLTGEPLPPELTFSRYFTVWDVDLIWLLLCGFGIFFYLAGVRRLRRRGDTWPVLRTVSWVLGLLVLFYLTNGGVAAYQDYLFSVHMLGHMGLTMLVPVLLVPGAPVTLAMRAIANRTDGSRGAREWILLAVHSKYAGFIAHPIVAAVLFVGSLWVFYYSPLFRWATVDHIGHEWMIVHFVLTGYLFVQSLIGIDPVPVRLGYPMRLLLLLATMAAHAFFGLSIMSNVGLMLPDWFGAMGRTWGAPPLVDQQNGGGIAWSIGELPTIALAITVAIQWSRSDAKDAKRLDRNADRTDDAELKEYNERLAKLAKSDSVS
ncbi:putative copper resistance protein D [Okibacterium sp. HSC-33S16]|uniref:cytochrome c oxidase assembly protein n=1 Tax=Okibacterium sp. HSC-33S16 TaxID=2910965 RepID=UPI00209DB1B0|nr:cytochrome c oxidase assembly protein [Okibacterium sp. HSC-33S16]MCP2031292.1 putative copper resistance protein D [Okibacterium sp. HSC-33S16]